MIMKFHFMQYFLLEHDDLHSSRSLVTIYDDFELDARLFLIQVLSDYERFLRILEFRTLMVNLTHVTGTFYSL